MGKIMVINIAQNKQISVMVFGMCHKSEIKNKSETGKKFIFDELTKFKADYIVAERGIGMVSDQCLGGNCNTQNIHEETYKIQFLSNEKLRGINELWITEYTKEFRINEPLLIDLPLQEAKCRAGKNIFTSKVECEKKLKQIHDLREERFAGGVKRAITKNKKRIALFVGEAHRENVCEKLKNLNLGSLEWKTDPNINVS